MKKNENLRFFNLNKPLNIEEVIAVTSCEVLNIDAIDIENTSFTNACAMEEAGKNDITFLINKKYATQLIDSNAGAVILSPADANFANNNMVVFTHKDPYYAYAKLVEYFYQPKNDQGSFDSSVELRDNAYIASTAKIGENTYIGPNAYIADDVIIGDNCFIDSGVMLAQSCIIGNNTKIYHGSTIQFTILGDNCIIHPGVRIGQDGFGFAFYQGRFHKVPQVGLVIIENDVEIGAGTTIDRGSAKNTIIGEGTKIDNLVQIGHNVEVGKHTIIVAMTGIAGSTKIGSYVQIGGQVGIAGHIKIGDKAKIAAKSGIHDDVADGTMVGGIPAQPVRDWHRQTAMLKKMIKHREYNDS